MYTRATIVFAVASLLISIPMASLADGHGEKQEAGSKAVEHQNEKAQESSNAKGKEDANKGKAGGVKAEEKKSE